MEKAWVISINMGYGHQRTAFALKDLAFKGKIINANDYSEIPGVDGEIWEKTRKFYEFISNFKRIPLIGNFAFSIFNVFQNILSFYPKRDLSKPNFTLKNIYSLFKKGWGSDLILRLSSPKENSRFPTGQAGQVEEPLPLISTFFTPAFMAEFFNYQGEIFCVVCDTDISRAWAPLDPKKSRIKYFAPTERAVERLKLYGVKPENIFLTGFPLPPEVIDGEQMEGLKEDLRQRLLNLDPQREYFKKYKILVEGNLGELPQKPDHLLTIMFVIGGAGAQKEIGSKLIKSLSQKIKTGQVKIILAVGIKENIKEYFIDKLKELGLEDGVEVIFEKDIESYFQSFNRALRKTDILWTKPSELCFYSALGLPIIIAPPIGSQEEFNKRWLLKSGFGIFQKNPAYTDQWLFNWLNKGYLAESAMQGFIEGEKLGTFNIKKIISK